MELWRDIRGYEGLYQVSNLGRVRSLDHYVKNKMGYRKIEGKVLTQTRNDKNYLIVSISKNNNKRVHILVAEAFLPNPHSYEHVHHKDHNPSNNRVENLEWISKEEHHALHQSDIVSSAKKACSIRVDQIDSKTGEVLRQWDRTMDVERELGYDHSSISKCCKGKQNTAYGFVWKYVKDIS